MKSFLIAGLFALAFSNPCASQTIAEKMKQVMNDYHRYNMFDGSVLVAQNGNVVYKDAFGQANREWNIPNTTDTKYHDRLGIQTHHCFPYVIAGTKRISKSR